MRVVINDATNIRIHAFYKIADYEKELNRLLAKKDWKNAISFINWLDNNNWKVFIYHSAKEKKEAEELKKDLDQNKAIFKQIIVPKIKIRPWNE